MKKIDTTQTNASFTNTNPFNLLTVFLIVAFTIAVYSGITNNAFLNYDDTTYITQNPHLQNGLSFQSIRWAFTTGYGSHWHPLTWISHLTDYTLFGLNPRGHHLMNLAIHILNTLLLYFALYEMFGKRGVSLWISLAFALHPMHVESVVWAAARKDTLSGFFFLTTIILYIRYAKQPVASRYAAVILSFIAGLMSKSMLVTTPVVLLLLDFWPLNRIILKSAPCASYFQCKQRSVRMIVLEKLPLLLCSIASSVVTFVMMHKADMVSDLARFSLMHRATNAVISYATYLWKLIFPVSLAVFYPHPVDIEWGKFAVAAAVIGIITFFVFRVSRAKPYLIVGWFFFLVTLLPVIGLLQVGTQAYADRYTYLPYIGLFIALAFLVTHIAEKHGNRKFPRGIAALAVASLVAMGTLTMRQVGYWRNTELLFERALEVTTNNWVAHNNLAGAYARQADLKKAEHHFKAALAIFPKSGTAHYNLGLLYAKQNNQESALTHYYQAATSIENPSDTYDNIGVIYAQKGELDSAGYYFKKSLQTDSANALAWLHSGMLAEQRQDYVRAEHNYRKAITINPTMSAAKQRLYSLGKTVTDSLK